MAADSPSDLHLQRVIRGAGFLLSDWGKITDVHSVDGKVAVADAFARAVYVFDLADRESEPVKAGRAGSGPGEFRVPSAVGITHDGRLVVYDERASRLTRFSMSGELIDAEPVSPQPQYGQIPESDVTASGHLFTLGFAEFQQGLEESLAGRTRGVARGRNHILRWDAAQEDWEQLHPVEGVEVFADVGSGSLDNIAHPRKPIWSPTAAGDRLWFADNGDTIASSIDLSTGKITNRRTTFSPLPISEASRQEYLNADDLRGRDENLLRQVRQRRSDLPFPNVLPPLLRILPDGQSVWFWGIVEGGTRLRRVDENGNTVSNYAVPEHFEPHLVNGRLVIGLHVDGDGVEEVAVYSLGNDN